ncbi:MAG TPA: SDR family oxidoreductase [Ktedonobacteraceae bacterium]|jgi:short-subunit dehydrogenase|nr:SDR family oxidoreductase [Ktedonobacteraceae bacterium]
MKVLVIGATSAIAQETSKCFARDGAELFLVARSPAKLAAVAADLRVRGALRVETYVLDLCELDQHRAMFEQAVTTLGSLDMLLIAHGVLGNQRQLEQDVEATLKNFTINCTSVIALLTISARYFERQRRGCMAVISSVAGDRGRQSNYTYGAAKAAINAFMQGLRNRLASAGVAVLTVEPGFVATPMTAHVKQGLLFAKPRSVGNAIYQAMRAGKDVVYVPWFWWPIMFVVRNIPERIFKRLSL